MTPPRSSPEVEEVVISPPFRGRQRGGQEASRINLTPRQSSPGGEEVLCNGNVSPSLKWYTSYRFVAKIIISDDLEETNGWRWILPNIRSEENPAEYRTVRSSCAWIGRSSTDCN